MKEGCRSRGPGARTALITGGAGFIGAHLSRALLNQGYEVRIIDNESTGQRQNVPPGARYFRGDVRNLSDLAAAFQGGVEVVFHLAAQVSNIKSFENPREDFTTNVLGTLNVLEMCERHGVPRLLYASSMAVYGEAGELPVGETSPCVPTSYYGISKHCAESYLLAASQNPLSRLKVTALRMFNVFGPLQSLTNPYQGVVSVFISNVISDQPVTIYGTGHQTRDFIYIDDIVRAWLLAIDNDAACNRAINLGSNTRVSVLELLTAVLEAAGKNGAPWPLRYEPRLFGDQDHIRCDNRLAGSLLGWQPQVSFLTGLQRTIRWAREGR